jgi:hypothetical protein
MRKYEILEAMAVVVIVVYAGVFWALLEVLFLN